MNDSLVLQSTLPSGVSSRTLKKLLFEHPNPEQFVKKIPAPALYGIIQQDGLESSSDIISLAGRAQVKTLLDFDIWTRDQVHEESLWGWLSLPDAENREDGLRLLQKVLSCIDLKVIAILIGRYVESVVHEEATDAPPGPSFYTPDKGHCWIKVDTGSEEHDFALNRTLALLFETNAEVFYQLLATSGIATPSSLEEDSYQERTKRLSEEGVPDEEFAIELTDPRSLHETLALLSDTPQLKKVEGVLGLCPRLRDAGRLPEPFESLVGTVQNREEFEAEFILLLNACAVRFAVDFSDRDSFALLVQQLLGALNIGLEKILGSLSTADRGTAGEKATTIVSLDHKEVYEKIGLQGLLKCGVAQILDLRKNAIRALKGLGEEAAEDQLLHALSLGFFRPFPHTLSCIGPTGDINISPGERLDVSPKAFEYGSELEACQKLLLEIDAAHQEARSSAK